MQVPDFEFNIYDIPSVNTDNRNIAIGKNVIFLLSSEDYNTHKTLFEKIKSAIPDEKVQNSLVLPLKKDEVINLASLDDSKLETVVVFGMKPSSLGFNASFKAYQFYQTESFSILFSHGLEKLDQNVNYKKALWTSLKEKFIVE